MLILKFPPLMTGCRYPRLLISLPNIWHFLETTKLFRKKFRFYLKKNGCCPKKTSIKMAEFQFLPYICGVLLRNFLKFD